MSCPARTARLQRVALVAAVLVVTACTNEQFAGEPTASAHRQHDPLLSSHAPPEVQKKIAELRRWSADFHNPDRAASAGYTANIGCIDETLLGVDASVASGMGYHVTRGDKDIVGDGVIDIDEPEFLVYAPHANDARLAKSERLGAARLVGFDYYIPGPLWPHPDPPEFFGQPFNWSVAFNGWIRHIYLWGNNPSGIFADFNPAVRLCTELLSP
jgi:hypothetical protein